MSKKGKYQLEELVQMDLNPAQKTKSPTKCFQGIKPMVLFTPWDDTYLYNLRDPYKLNHQTLVTYYCINYYINTIKNELEEIGMIYLKPVNQLMTKIEITKLAPPPRPSKNLRGKKICMSGFDTAHIKFSNTPEDKFQDQLC